LRPHEDASLDGNAAVFDTDVAKTVATASKYTVKTATAVRMIRLAPHLR